MGYSLGSDRGNSSGNNDGWWLLVVVLLVLVVAAGVVVASNVTLFEDGSAVLGGFDLGCVIRSWGCN